MELQPILSAMRRNKVGALLIGVQMAITLAILCNALFIIEQRVALSRRPTGLDEANVFTVSNQWISKSDDLDAKLATDLAAIRAVPGVIDVTATNSIPLSGGGSTDGLLLKAEQKEDTDRTAVYMVDEHGIQAMGLKLVAGRNFLPEEVLKKNGFDDRVAPAAVIITKKLADKLFPNGDAVGQVVYPHFLQRAGRREPVPVVGVVDRLQVPWTTAGGWGSTFNDNSSLVPFHYASRFSFYLVHTRPGQVHETMKAVEKALFAVSRLRVVDQIQTQAEARLDAYRDDRGLAIILGIVCAALLAITAFGIVGLTSYWVAQRRRQIGIRRALGATRNAIVRYFQTENFLIAAGGAAAGVALALVLNVWMMSFFATERLNGLYAVVGAVVVLLLGQLAVLYPALRAASIPPALATRGSM
jgi:putative ABC transport system permease protein